MTRRVEPTATMVTYLRVIGELQTEFGWATVRSVAGALGVSDPSASAMVKRLRRSGFLIGDNARQIMLSRLGAAVACEELERIGLIQRHLIEALGYGPADARREATRLAPALSEVVSKRLRAMSQISDATSRPSVVEDISAQPLIHGGQMVNEAFG